MHLSNIGISGTRCGGFVPASQARTLSALLNTCAAAQLPVNVGCCPSGFDKLARNGCQSRGLRFSVYSVAGHKSPAALRSRTLKLVSSSSALFAFPKSPQFQRSGTWLSVFAAASQGIPVFVSLPGASGGTLPTCKNIVSWRSVSGSALPAPLHRIGAGHSFFAPSIHSVQISIF